MKKIALVDVAHARRCAAAVGGRTDAIMWDPRGCDEAANQEITSQVRARGFAIAQVGEVRDAKAVLATMANALDLGQAFLPPLYRTSNGTQSAITTLSAPSSATGVRHPAFETMNGQAFHTDGTLQAIDEIKTTLLLCETPANTGGETTIFDVVNAWLDLQDADPDAAMSLTEPCLLRRATVNFSNDAVIGPVVAITPNGVVVRYSQTATDQWFMSDADDCPVRRAVTFLNSASVPRGCYSWEFGLRAGELLVFANSRLAHGRNSYTDGIRPRRYHRGLYKTAV